MLGRRRRAQGRCERVLNEWSQVNEITDLGTVGYYL